MKEAMSITDTSRFFHICDFGKIRQMGMNFKL